MDSNQQSPGGVDAQASLRAIPSVDRVLAHPVVASLQARLPQNIITMAVREELEELRRSLRGNSGKVPSLEEVAKRSASRALDIVAPSLRPVINATGVIVHTNLGRAPLSRAAL